MRASHHSACSFLARPDHDVVGFARDFPFLPLLLERGVQLLAQRLQLCLPLVPDDVDLGVVGDGFERDVRHALIDEALADVAMRRLRADGAVRVTSASLSWPSRRIGEQVIRIARAHDASASQRERHARGVDGDPAAAPLLGDVGGRAGTAGGVEDEVAGVGGHENALCDDRGIRLHNINLWGLLRI